MIVQIAGDALTIGEHGELLGLLTGLGQRQCQRGVVGEIIDQRQLFGIKR